jgi:VWFA-related protein
MKKPFCKLKLILLVSAFWVGIRAGSAWLCGQTESSPAKHQETDAQRFKIKVDVDLVATDVTVIGTPVSPFLAEDFVIFDNGVAQEATNFSRDPRPLAVAILVDGSLSTAPYLPVLQIAAASALRRLKSEDQVMLYTFNSSIIKLNDLTEDRLLIAEKIGKIKVAFQTNLYGTVFEAAQYLRKNAPNRRRAIILISDNCHYMGTHSADSCRVELLDAATTLYDLRAPGDTQGVSQCFKEDADVKQLAHESGGEVIDVQGPTNLQEGMEKAISNLRMQYTLGFNPSAPGETGSFHKLQLKLKSEDRCPGCRLLTRSGYYTGVAQVQPVTANKPDTPRQSPEEVDKLLIERSIATAGSIDIDLPGIPFSVTTAQQKDSAGEPQIKVDLQIGLAGDGFKIVEGKHVCKLRIAVFYATPKGKILGSDWRGIEGQLSDETYQQALKTGISFSAMVPLKAENQILKVVVYDEETDKVGSKLVRLR